MILADGTGCYAMRRVNPFQGIVAVVKRPAARAISLDGRSWQLQTLGCPRPVIRRPGAVAEPPRYVRFGSWSADDGLTRFPINPALDVSAMVAACEELVGALAGVQKQLPFPLADTRELCLLDRANAPIALLGTALPDADPGAIENRSWDAGGRDERPFVSSLLSARAVPERDGSGRRHHVEAVERRVLDAAGRPARMQWFRFEADAAVGLDPVWPARPEPAPLAGRKKTAAHRLSAAHRPF